MAADREAMRHTLHLDMPLMQQYGLYLQGLFSGNWGQSIIDHRDVWLRMMERLPATAITSTYCNRKSESGDFIFGLN